MNKWAIGGLIVSGLAIIGAGIFGVKYMENQKAIDEALRELENDESIHKGSDKLPKVIYLPKGQTEQTNKEETTKQTNKEELNDVDFDFDKPMDLRIDDFDEEKLQWMMNRPWKGDLKEFMKNRENRLDFGPKKMYWVREEVTKETKEYRGEYILKYVTASIDAALDKLNELRKAEPEKIFSIETEFAR